MFSLLKIMTNVKVCYSLSVVQRLLSIVSLCPVAFGFLCLFLTASLIGLQCVVVALSGHTHFLNTRAVQI